MTFSERVKQVKNEKNITSAELSVKSGVPLGTLTKLLSGAITEPKLSVALAIAMGYTRAESLKGKWLFKLCTWVLSGFICASTVFIKQHSILDVFGGIAMFIIVWIAVEVVERVYNKESLRWKANREAEK